MRRGTLAPTRTTRRRQTPGRRRQIRAANADCARGRSRTRQAARDERAGRVRRPNGSCEPDVVRREQTSATTTAGRTAHEQDEATSVVNEHAAVRERSQRRTERPQTASD
ncbi:hypothetical protein JTE90_012049 [Oedothorax gibbosus]|uniref:Uncharacterized protein n=1 Tax=Oedothorax gibbosus TaxID=931172 RepID=A0AAV6TDS2_9ARAC|nr:hypothetical protein JTE90_012049 [Oedothorax gibbosus]